METVGQGKEGLLLGWHVTPTRKHMLSDDAKEVRGNLSGCVPQRNHLQHGAVARVGDGEVHQGVGMVGVTQGGHTRTLDNMHRKRIAHREIVDEWRPVGSIVEQPNGDRSERCKGRM